MSSRTRRKIPKFIVGEITEPTRAQFVLPAFLLPVPTWLGASDIIAQYSISNSYYFSLKLPIEQFGENFVLAIRWAEGTIIRRFKLWGDIGEVLYFPVYAGERIGYNAVFELWSIDSEAAPELDEESTLDTSVLIMQDDSIVGNCCTCTNGSLVTTLTQSTPSVLPPYANCNPFCTSLCSP